VIFTAETYRNCHPGAGWDPSASAPFLEVARWAPAFAGVDEGECAVASRKPAYRRLGAQWLRIQRPVALRWPRTQCIPGGQWRIATGGGGGGIGAA